jgi:hypothetical protein
MEISIGFGERSLMKIPNDATCCSECQRKLNDEDFVACGAGLNRAYIFFDYKCLGCGYYGRYTYDVIGGLDPVKSLNALSNCLTEAEKQEVQYSKEKLIFQLNKIKGVKDLLKLAGNEAPHEPSRDENDGRNLP